LTRTFLVSNQHGEGDEDPHLVQDRFKLQNMIDSDNQKEKVLDKPEVKKVTDDNFDWKGNNLPEFVQTASNTKGGTVLV